MGTQSPAGWAFAYRDDDLPADTSTYGDSSFCIEMDPDDSTGVYHDAPASERDYTQRSLAALNTPSALAVDTSKKWANGQTLTVCFFGGSTTLQRRVQNSASQWMQFANIKFHFVAGRSANIRIAFTGRGGASESYVGTGNLSINPSLPTMNLGLDDDSPLAVIQGTTLHEFGHALGCVHEHQQPNSTIVWNEEAVFAAHRGRWPEWKVRSNIFNKYNRNQVQGSNFDQYSIMLYEIPLAWTRNGFSSKANYSLSTTDKAFISAMYPFTARPPPVVPTTPKPPVVVSPPRPQNP
jgi:hypothetical protein